MKTTTLIRSFYVAAIISTLIIAGSAYEVFTWPEVVHYEHLLSALAAQTIQWILLAVAWRQTLICVFQRPVALAECFVQLSMVMVGKYIPGKVWGMLARGVHLKTSGLDYTESLIATYIEQLLIVHTGVTLGALAWSVATGAAVWIVLCVVSLLGIALVPILNAWLFGTGNRIVRRWLPDTIQLPKNPPAINTVDYLWLYCLYTIHWLADLAIPSAVILIISPQWPTTDLFLLLAGANAFGIILGFFAFFAPGGLGVREGVIVGLMMPYMPLQDATLFALAYRLWLVAADLLSLGVVFAIRRPDAPKGSGEETKG